MPVREIGTSPPWDKGLDFGGYFHNQQLVEAALLRLISPLPAIVGYCLRFHADEGDAWFEPYGGTGLIAVEQAVELPSKVQLTKLLPSSFHWPVLAESIPGEPISPIFSNAVWKGQVRLVGLDGYVGYFKIIAIGKEKISDDDFFVAYIAAKTWLDQKVDDLQQRSQQRSAVLSATHTHIRENLAAGKTRIAIQHLAFLITSHLGANLNRAVVFMPIDAETLECVHAHGGDGTKSWTGLQEAVSKEATSVDALHLMTGDELVEDPLGKELIGNKVAIDSESLIAAMWRNQLTLNFLPEDRTLALPPLVEFSNTDVEIPLVGQRILGAVIDESDPWLVELRKNNAESVVFNSLNGQWFVVPWKCGSKPMGVFLFDLAHWDMPDTTRDVIPRVRVASEILEHFAPNFADIAIC